MAFVSKKIKICPVCGEGNLVQHTESQEISFNGVKHVVNELLYTSCEDCGSEITSPEHSRLNKKNILASRKELEGLLPANAIRTIRNKFRLTQQQAADLLGGGAVAFSKYESNDVAQSTAMDRLLRVTNAVPGVFEWLVSFTGVDLNQNEKTFQGSYSSICSTRSQRTSGIIYHEVPVFGAFDVAANHTGEYIDETKPPKSEPLSAA